MSGSRADPADRPGQERRPRRASAVVVLTGAGISTDSGIPDFRGPEGRLDEEPGGREDVDTRSTTWAIPRCGGWRGRTRRDSPAWDAEPNAGHSRVVELERAGELHTLVTQNVDGLHQAAGQPTRPRWSRCTAPSARSSAWRAATARPWSEALDRVRAGEDDPPCRTCGGMLKSATISFGQSLVPEDLDRAEHGRRGVRPAARDRHDAQRVPGGRTWCRSRSARRHDRDRRTPSRPRWTTLADVVAAGLDQRGAARDASAAAMTVLGIVDRWPDWQA